MSDSTALSSLRFRRAAADRSPASGLIEAMISELTPLYGRIDVPGAPSADPADFTPPAGSFLVGWQRGEPVCGGALKRLSVEAAEIKRMYVAPAARGQGVARALLEALEREARRLGYRAVRLDTGPHQPHARSLYESAGYRAISDYNANPFANFWGEKRLGQT